MEEILTEDMHNYLAKHYFPNKDCLSLALSGVSERFTVLYGTNRKVLDISRCSFLAPEPWMEFFQKHILPTASSIRVFNANHIYWLSPEILCGCIVEMENLEELRIHNTKITLLDLPQIFKACPKLTKLSFNLVERNMDHYQEGVMEKSELDLLTAGFARLKELKMFVDQCSDGDIWLVTLEVLKWCRDCTSLFLELTPHAIPSTWRRLAHDSASSSSVDDVEESARISRMKEFFPHLEWMRSLKTLHIVKRTENFLLWDDLLAELLVSWIFCKNEYENCSPMPASLEHVWLDVCFLTHSRLLSEYHFTGSSLKSFFINNPWSRLKLDHERFCQLEILGGIFFHDGYSHLPHLKSVLGTVWTRKSCKEFFETHPLLEKLYLNHYYDQEITIAGNWRLLRLKFLNYKCSSLKRRNIDRLVDACPNIEELHVSSSDPHRNRMADDDRYLFSTIRFRKLKWLTVSNICLRDGTRLPSIAEQCPKIERLHLDGCFLIDTLFSPLDQQFLVAKNLRDLRLVWDLHHFSRDIRDQYSDMSARVLVLLKDLKKSCPKLERVALQYRGNCPLSQELEDYLFSFTTGMEHLEFVYLVGFNIDPARADRIKEKLNEMVLPLRPSFWCHVGSEQLDSYDPSVPMVHYREMIYPLYGDALPNF